MDIIKKLIKLQECYNQISNYNVVLKDEARLNRLKVVKEKFENHKKDYEGYIHSLKKLDLETIALENKLNLSIKELQKVEYDLYNESGSDLNLIENMQNKEESLKGINKTISEKVDTDKGRVKELKIKIIRSRKNIEGIKEDFLKEKNEFTSSVNEAKTKIPLLTKVKAGLEKEIPSAILDNFEYLINNKDNAVVELKDGICIGCRMMVSSMTIDNMNKEDIVCCDNCGRILYISK